MILLSSCTTNSRTESIKMPDESIGLGIEYTEIECDRCGGTGLVCTESNTDSSLVRICIDCPKCNGKGYVKILSDSVR